MNIGRQQEAHERGEIYIYIYIYIIMANLHCCTAETNTTL